MNQQLIDTSSPSLSIGIVLRKVLQPLRGVALGPLQRQSQRPVPVKLAQPSHGPRHAEQHRVILILGEPVMPQQHARVRIDVGERIGHLAVLGEDARHDRVDRLDDLEELVVGHVFQAKLALARVSRVGLAEDGVTVSRDDLLGVECLPCEFGNGLGVHLLALLLELFLQRLDPLENLLVRESVERTRQRVQPRPVRQVRIRQCRSHEVSGVRGRVAALVIGMDAQVQAHELVEGRVVVPKHACEVAGVVEGLILGDDAVEVDVTVDRGGDLGDDGEDV
mmetsp:Transcript_36952/g.89096  ORF Transcript_36952/g.89096 Transcript_36952/m.89096 type:complete len:279 (+) Transcript_36952:161-997(+)